VGQSREITGVMASVVSPNAQAYKNRAVAFIRCEARSFSCRSALARLLSLRVLLVPSRCTGPSGRQVRRRAKPEGWTENRRA
jgi:hypothetical protein